MFETFSAELKEARESLGMSLEQLASKIKIDIKFLEAIEIGDFTFLPEIYVRAFLKEYVRTVGLDENKMLKKFSQIRDGKYTAEADQPIENETPATNQPQQYAMNKPLPQRNNEIFDTYKKDPPANNKNQLIMIGTFVLVVLAIAIYLFLIRGSSKQIITEKPYDEVLEERSLAERRRFLEDSETINEISESDSLVLSIRAVDSSWFRIVTDKNIEKEYYLRPKQSIELKASESFSLVIGNSSGVSLTLNNEILPLNVVKGRALKCIVDRNGLSYPDNVIDSNR
jgi:cytoskeletal protein RodZ